MCDRREQGKAKAKRQRDNWKARAMRYEHALQMIEQYCGKNVLMPIRGWVYHEGFWCAEIAREALKEAQK